jgi:hypothetical protein
MLSVLSYVLSVPSYVFHGVATSRGYSSLYLTEEATFTQQESPLVQAVYERCGLTNTTTLKGLYFEETRLIWVRI